MRENVANNVVQPKVQDFTEQWEKGELEKGYYYVKGIKKYDGINVYWIGNPIHESERRWIEEVLAPVPSYEEWLQLNEVIKRTKASGNYPSKVSQYKARITMLTEENQQLKTLLKEWMHFYPIILYEHEDTLKTKDIVELFDKTANAIGEKK